MQKYIYVLLTKAYREFVMFANLEDMKREIEIIYKYIINGRYG